ncbi:MAG: hypothetical protein WBP81_02465 [Solirubrobacteraceae bacterium]
MTEQTHTNPQSAPKSPARATAARPSLYRRVLGLGVAAIVAAWLPFSVMYISSLNRHATPVVAVNTPHSGSATRVVTTASGATKVVPAGGSTASAPAAQLTPIKTRVS